MAILAVNAGSSSLKFSLHPLQDGQVQSPTLAGSIQGLEPQGSPTMEWSAQGERAQRVLSVPAGDSPFVVALQALRALALEQQGEDLQAIAHRVVHGGGVYTASVRVTDEVLEQLASFNSLAPLHQPHNLEGIRQFRAAFPELPQIACFDTAFHATVPVVEHAFALPQDLYDQGVRRYGFHGLSYQYIIGKLHEHSTRARGRVVMAHLGNGASLCGCRNGTSVATTMGFSALDGLMMGTRSGAIDAGVLLYLLEQGWDHARIEKLLYRQSGLLGVSGISADVRRLRADNSASAQRAIAQFSHRVVRETGAIAACLGGLDVLAFSGGIGENDPILRDTVCSSLAWMGVRLDAERNHQASGHAAYPVHAPDSTVEVWVIPTDEGRVAAREAAALL